MLSHHRQRNQRQYGRPERSWPTFSECKRHSADRLFSHWPNNYGAILCKHSRPNTGKDTQTKVRFGKEKSHLSSGKGLPTHKCYYHGKNHELRYELLPYSSDLAPSDFNLSPSLKVYSVGRDVLQRKSWELKWRGILKVWRNRIFEMGSGHWNITGPNALVNRETVFKNENISTEVRRFFLVHSENFSNPPHIGNIVNILLTENTVVMSDLHNCVYTTALTRTVNVYLCRMLLNFSFQI